MAEAMAVATRMTIEVVTGATAAMAATRMTKLISMELGKAKYLDLDD